MPDEPKTPVPQDEIQQHLKKIAEAVASLARSTDAIRDEATKITRQSERKTEEELNLANRFFWARISGGGLSLSLHGTLLVRLIWNWVPRSVGTVSVGATIGYCVAIVALLTSLVLSLFLCCRRSDD